jgi:phage FluMu protein Com
MAKQEKPIRVAHNEVFQVIAAGPPNGTVLAMNLTCGSCGFKFEGRYTMAQLSLGAFPHETCPKCKTVNYVPYTASGRNDAR